MERAPSRRERRGWEGSEAHLGAVRVLQGRERFVEVGACWGEGGEHRRDAVAAEGLLRREGARGVREDVGVVARGQGEWAQEGGGRPADAPAGRA